jgi:predicted DNA-binding transcriptional regulator YafY
MFYRAMQYGENIEVLTPERLRGKIAEAAKGMVEKYRK